MSLKENVDYVKSEINSQERMLESFVKVERFFKKYKKLFFGLIVIIIALAVAAGVKSYLDEQNKIKSNKAFNQFLLNNSDSKALEELKNTNKKLYEVALFIKSNTQEVTEKIDNEYLSSLVDYRKALENKSIEGLNLLTQKDGFLLKDFALFNKALLLIKEGKHKEAKEVIVSIDQGSKVYELVEKLNHYLLTK